LLFCFLVHHLWVCVCLSLLLLISHFFGTGFGSNHSSAACKFEKQIHVFSRSYNLSL
jgi:preprotein translocase subunit SecG